MVEIEYKGDFIQFKTDEGSGNFVILNEKLISLRYKTDFGYLEYLGTLNQNNITYALNVSANSIESNKILYNSFKELLKEIDSKFYLNKQI